MKSLQTVQTIAKVLRIVFLVLLALMAVAVVATFIGAILMLAVPYFDEIGWMENIFWEASVDNAKELAVAMIAELMVMIGTGAVLFFALRYVHHELKDGTPFTRRGAKELLTLGVIALAAPLAADLIASGIISIAGLRTWVLQGSDIGYGIICIVLSYVFQYGADILQSVATEEVTEITENCVENEA